MTGIPAPVMESIGFWFGALVVLVLFLAYSWVLWSLHGQMTKRQAALVACETRARKNLAHRAARYFVKRATGGATGGATTDAPNTGVNDSVGLV